MLKYALALLTLVILVTMGLVFVHLRQEQDMTFLAESYAVRQLYTEHIIKMDPLSFTDAGIIKEYKVDRDSLGYNSQKDLLVTIIINQDSALSMDFELSDQGDGSYSVNYFEVSPPLKAKLEEELSEAFEEGATEEVPTEEPPLEETPGGNIIDEETSEIEPEMAI